MMISQSLPLLLLRAITILAAPAATNTCTTVQSKYPEIMVAMPTHRLFQETQTEYWNKGCGTSMKPTCIIFPHSTEEVSKVVQVLNENNESFAIKGGGHMPNKAFNRLIPVSCMGQNRADCCIKQRE
jgi:hypothetical protein